MTDTKHTPTPWKIENWHGDTQIIGPEGSLICIDTTYYPVAPSEEDMAHIVKCVNMHDELVEALKDIIDRSHNDPLGTSKVLDMRKIAEKTLKKAGAL